MFKQLFRTKPKEKPLELADILCNDAIKHIVDTFIEDHMPKANGIIQIWISGDHVNFESAGFSESEAVWALNKAIQQILSKGIALND